MKRYIAPIVLSLLLIPSLASAAISFDTNSAKLTGTGTNTFTPGTGSNAVMVIWVEGEVGGSDNVTGVTVDTHAATQETKLQCAASDFDYGYLYLGGGDGASHNIVVSTTGASPLYHVVSYFGVKQSTTIDATNNSDTSYSIAAAHNSSITTIADNSWALIWVSQTGSRTATITSGGTTRVSLSGSDNLVGDSNAAVHPAGSNTFTITPGGSGSSNGCSLMMSLAPAPATASNPFQLWPLSLF